MLDFKADSPSKKRPMYISELESIKFRTNKKGICILCRACIGKLFVQNNLLVYLN